MHLILICLIIAVSCNRRTNSGIASAFVLWWSVFVYQKGFKKLRNQFCKLIFAGFDYIDC